MNTKDLDERLRKALAKNRPSGVQGAVTRTGVDSTGDPAVWVWIILEDDGLLKQSRDEIERVRGWAEAAARSVSDAWPYVTFRTRAEQQEVEEEESKRK